MDHHLRILVNQANHLKRKCSALSMKRTSTYCIETRAEINVVTAVCESPKHAHIQLMQPFLLYRSWRAARTSFQPRIRAEAARARIRIVDNIDEDPRLQ